MPDIDAEVIAGQLFFQAPVLAHEGASVALGFELVDEEGEPQQVPFTSKRQQDQAMEALFGDNHLDGSLRLRARDGLLELSGTLRWHGPALHAGVRLAVDLPGIMHEPRWLVPGCFYRENRPVGTSTVYPRATLEPDPDDPFASPRWSFRSDRTASAAVFGWTDQACVGIATDPTSTLGMTGVGFGVTEGRARIWIDLPFREEPVVYRGTSTPGAANVSTHAWTTGEELTVSALVMVGDPEPHAYDPLLRAAYAHDREQHALTPWMSVEEAAALTAHGLHAWHWRPEHDALFETAAFDRAHSDLDRPTMHVGWVSGIPWAHALLAYGRRVDHADYVTAGTRVIDHICSARTPAGTFWGEWRRDKGWGCGWNRDPDRLHARTLAEATLFTVRAVRAELAHGVEHDAWRAAIADNLDFATSCQDEDGNLGSYYHQATGEVEDRTGAAGLLWIAALAEGASLFDRDDWRDAARRAGRSYARFVEDAFVHGAPEDVHLAPTSEDAYNALIAYVRLHEVDPDPSWLELATAAANWTMTFRWSYNVTFDPHTILRTYDFRTRGADNASPPNQHLHAYGLIAHEELVRLSRLTGDDYLRDRAHDNLACFLQLIARGDGDFNAQRGMVTERYYHTDCFQPKGSILTLSHAWCVGVTLLACQVAIDDRDARPEREPV